MVLVAYLAATIRCLLALFHIIQNANTHSESAPPYVLFKDADNAKSNQEHLRTIKSSNLCAGERKERPPH
jgi:hypothetical protein